MTRALLLLILALLLSSCGESVSERVNNDARDDRIKWAEKDTSRLEDRVIALEERVKKLEERQ